MSIRHLQKARIVLQHGQTSAQHKSFRPTRRFTSVASRIAAGSVCELNQDTAASSYFSAHQIESTVLLYYVTTKQHMQSSFLPALRSNETIFQDPGRWNNEELHKNRTIDAAHHLTAYSDCAIFRSLT